MSADEPELTVDRGRLRTVGRRVLGVSGARAPQPLDRDSRAAIAVTGTLGAASLGIGVALVLLGPSLTRATGITGGGRDAGQALFLLVVAALALVAAARVNRFGSRRSILLASGAVAALAALVVGLVANLRGLAVARLLDGVAGAGAGATHLPTVADTAGLGGRVRGMTIYRGAASGTLALLAVGSWVLVEGLDLTWRAVFVVVAVVMAALVVVARRVVGEPSDRDDEALHDALAVELGASDGVHVLAAAPPSLTDGLRRTMLVPGVRRILVLEAVLGLFTFPFLILVGRFLRDYWSLRPGSQMLVAAVVLAVPVAGLAWFGRQGEQAWAAAPALLVDRVGIVVAVGGVALIVGAFVAELAVVIVAFAVAAASAAIAQATLDAALMTVVPRPMRTHAAALAAGAASVGGGLVLFGVANAVAGRSGVAWGLAIVGLAAVAARFGFAGLAVEVDAGIDRQIDGASEEVRAAITRSSGGHVPLLACRGIDFAYGPVQVLFDVDFTVDDGEMVALLGTNGAGKSTLLRVISGIGYPSAGTVRFRGEDITHLEPAKRVGAGITQIPGGKAAFGSMTVLENLRLNAYSLGNDRAATTRALDRSFEVFPRLDERRHQAAATLSGGERQMLALSKALMLDPSLLLIDELSLGLAPVVVAELLDRVRHINEQGTAVVLVEQSVNVALSLVDHAYFMEKGEVRFDGPSEELMARPDIVRSVFLEGAAKGLAQ